MKSILVVAAFALSAPSPASSDVDVDPVPWSPVVRVGAENAHSPKEQKEEMSDATSSGSAPEICFQAPGAKISGFSCSLANFPGTFSATPAEAGDIERAIREVPMRALELHVQPDGRTLVNVDTIFYTESSTVWRTVALLGHQVRLVCRPVRFTWVHGDGSQRSTSEPGRPYPAKDVTHQYERPETDLQARVDTTYRVRYSVDGGGWSGLDEMLTAPGPTSVVDVDEATPVLTN